ncbi:phage portal protein [Vibrio sp. HN007]|uniref:phage portal protein n=1 Tax=Vibrio iocasae TaxID=3098914 RepID=UPI0035D472D5
MTESKEILSKQEDNEKESSSVYSFDPTPEPVDSSSWMTAYSELFYNEMDDYWEPPISRNGLSEISRANAYHGSLLIARANYVAARFVTGGGMRLRQMQAFCRDYFTFGDGGLLKIRNGFGKVVRLHPLPGMHMRRRKNGDFVVLERDNKQRVYKQKDVIFLPQYDPAQQIYGLPDYLGGIQSGLLNTDATLFRRRYYKNGAHMGFIFYANDENLSVEDEKYMKEAIQSSKGIGNFRSMFVNIPGGSEKGIQLIPVGDIATKDEFERIKNITSQDILVSHRFPTGKAGIIPQGTANMGDPVKIGSEYAKDEIVPVCKLIADEINSDPETSGSLKVQFDLNTGSEE